MFVDRTRADWGRRSRWLNHLTVIYRDVGSDQIDSWSRGSIDWPTSWTVRWERLRPPNQKARNRCAAAARACYRNSDRAEPALVLLAPSPVAGAICTAVLGAGPFAPLSQLGWADLTRLFRDRVRRPDRTADSWSEEIHDQLLHGLVTETWDQLTRYVGEAPLPTPENDRHPMMALQPTRRSSGLADLMGRIELHHYQTPLVQATPATRAILDRLIADDPERAGLGFITGPRWVEGIRAHLDHAYHWPDAVFDPAADRLRTLADLCLADRIWFGADFCVIVDQPISAHWEPAPHEPTTIELHHDYLPALTWDDGTKLHMHHGRPAPAVRPAKPYDTLARLIRDAMERARGRDRRTPDTPGA